MQTYLIFLTFATKIKNMNGIYILLTILVYFSLLLVVAKLTSKRADNDAFFRGNRKSPWYVVAFGMVGASLSGVTFVSVPGMVRGIDMTYMQTCMGFFVGYLIIAHVLLPLYYKLNLTTIYFIQLSSNYYRGVTLIYNPFIHQSVISRRFVSDIY